MQRLLIALTIVLLSGMPVFAQMQELLKKVPGVDTGSDAQGSSKAKSSSKSGLSDVKIGSGLKEALKVGTGNTVDRTGRENGYFANQAIKILMPDSLRTVEQGLRLAGYGDRVDELVVSMNRAAEKAAPFARDIFLDAIGAMTFDDVQRIFNGGDMAATQYFQRKTTNKLASTFQPIVERTMNEVGVVQHYNNLIGQYQNLPLVQNVAFDINRYVVDKALDGLFHVLGEEEQKIRKNPAARVTDLLKDVFGR